MHKALHPRDDIDRLYVARKKRRKRTYQHSRLSQYINTKTRRPYKKVQRKSDYSHQKQYRQHKHQQIKNIEKTKMGRKTTIWTFHVISEISRKKTWTWVRKGDLKRGTESLLSTKQCHEDYVKVKIDKMQKNNRCRLCDDRD